MQPIVIDESVLNWFELRVKISRFGLNASGLNNPQVPHCELRNPECVRSNSITINEIRASIRASPQLSQKLGSYGIREPTTFISRFPGSLDAVPTIEYSIDPSIG